MTVARIPPPDDSVSPGARQKLLDAAVELFATRGYAGTSVREVVERAGLTKPALYYHFGSKEGIYLEILKGIHQLAAEALTRLSARSGSSRERLSGLAAGLFELFEQNVSGARFMNSALWGPPQGAPPFDFLSFHIEIQEAVRRIVEEGIAAGDLRPAPPEDIVHAFMGALSFSFDVHLAHPDWSRGLDGLRRVVDLLFLGLAPTPNQEKQP
jgi:TetR/AcrR family transcriptional regulator